MKVHGSLLLGILLITPVVQACYSSPDDADDEASESAYSSVPGNWNPPPDVRAAGAAQFIRYEGPPPWDGGAHCSGRLLDGTRELGDYLKATFPGVSSYGGYSCRQNTANAAETSVHGTGRAIDVFIPKDGAAADNGKGDPVANFLIVHAQEIGIQYIIWDRTDWSGGHGGDKLGTYGGPVPHVDHLHVELTHAGANRQTPWFNQDVMAFAFQANTGDLWITGEIGTRSLGVGMMEGTSPAIAMVPGIGWLIAFQANTGELWTVSATGPINWQLGMKAGTSPSIAAVPGMDFVIAFQANTGELWSAWPTGRGSSGLGMAEGTSPSVAAVPGMGWVIAFQANTGELWTVWPEGSGSSGYAMAEGTSPSIAAVPGMGFVYAFQADTGDLWVGSQGGGAAAHGLNMKAGTSPSIAAVARFGWATAFQADDGNLWTFSPAGATNWGLGMQEESSPFIRGRRDGSFTIGFEANTGELWKGTQDGGVNVGLGMKLGTSPAGT